MDSLAIGRRLAHYEILALVGAGGMGEVYRARDLKLGREVAIKVLPSSMSDDPLRRSRFEREAKAVAALNHPGIVTLHSVEEEDGLLFLTMELLQGDTLARTIPSAGFAPDRLLDLALSIVDAVAAAHAQGITHRDLKPQNILVTREGRPKVLDFGLATQSLSQDSQAETSLRTAAGIVVGTVAYMSPEQALGEAVDPRSDVFSLGIVLYEMLTGRRPFTGQTATQTIGRLLHAEPEPIDAAGDDTRAGLARVVGKCLRKDRALRYVSAREILVDLEALRSGSVHTRTVATAAAPAATMRRPGHRVAALVAVAVLVIASALALYLRSRSTPTKGGAATVAVLPFENLSDDPENGFFAQGVHEDVMTRLAGLKSLRVISRTSVTRVARTSTPSEVGERLGARYVVEGSVRRAGAQVRVTARLTDTTTDLTLWSANYDRELVNVFDLQSSIAREIATTLDAAIGPDERGRLDAAPTTVVEAYDRFLKARNLLSSSRVGHEELQKAIGYLTEATGADPRFAAAWALLSQAHCDRCERLKELDSREADARAAAEAARRALARARQHDPGGVATLRAEGYFYKVVEGDTVNALRSLDAALALEPDDSETLLFQALLFMKLGQLARVVPNFERAYAVDPGNPRVTLGLTFAYELSRRYAEMVPVLERLLALEPEKTHYGPEARYYQFLADGKLSSFRAFEQAVRTVRRTDRCDLRAVRNREMFVAMFAGDFAGYAKAWEGKWERHQRGHGQWACPGQLNDEANHARLLLERGAATPARAIIEHAKKEATLPYTEMSLCIFDRATFKPKLDYLSGDRERARREFDEAVARILKNDSFPRGAVEKAVLLETADLVAPDRVYPLYREIVQEPVSLIGLEQICANPWTYPNLLRDPRFVAEVRKDGRFVLFLEHHGLLAAGRATS